MTVRLHHDEVRIDEELVRQLLRTQLPDLANLDLRLIPAQGTDNVVFPPWGGAFGAATSQVVGSAESAH